LAKKFTFENQPSWICYLASGYAHRDGKIYDLLKRDNLIVASASLKTSIYEGR
jgi:hypothetical protein